MAASSTLVGRWREERSDPRQWSWVSQPGVVGGMGPYPVTPTRPAWRPQQLLWWRRRRVAIADKRYNSAGGGGGKDSRQRGQQWLQDREVATAKGLRTAPSPWRRGHRRVPHGGQLVVPRRVARDPDCRVGVSPGPTVTTVAAVCRGAAVALARGDSPTTCRRHRRGQGWRAQWLRLFEVVMAVSWVQEHEPVPRIISRATRRA